MDTTTSTTPRIIADLAFAEGLIRQVGPERIVSVYVTPSVVLHPADDEDGHAIATALGLGLDITDTRHRADYTAYHGDIEGRHVTVFASPLRFVVFDVDTGEALSPPMSHDDASALAIVTRGRHAELQAVSR